MAFPDAHMADIGTGNEKAQAKEAAKARLPLVGWAAKDGAG